MSVRAANKPSGGRSIAPETKQQSHIISGAVKKQKKHGESCCCCKHCWCRPTGNSSALTLPCCDLASSYVWFMIKPNCMSFKIRFLLDLSSLSSLCGTLSCPSVWGERVCPLCFAVHPPLIPCPHPSSSLALPCLRGIFLLLLSSSSLVL